MECRMQNAKCRMQNAEDRGCFFIFHSAFFILHLLSVFKKAEALADESQESPGVHLQLVRGDDGAVNFLDQQLVPDLFGEGGMVFLEKAAFAGDGFDYSLAFPIPCKPWPRCSGSSAIPRPGGGWRAGPRRAEGSGSRRVADLVHQLQVSRLAGFEINLNQHKILTVL